MNFLSNIKTKGSGCILFLMCLCFYFGYFGIKGDRGWLKYQHLQNQISEAKIVKDNYEQERIDWEKKVKLLSSTSLDLDLLDERARTVLNVIGDDEFIILDEDI